MRLCAEHRNVDEYIGEPSSQGGHPVQGIDHVGWKLAIELSADPAAVRLVRKLIAAAARIEGAADLEAHLIEVAVGEALARGSVGNKRGASAVTVAVEHRGGRFIVPITEDAETPRHDNVAADSGDDDALGWGLYVIAQVMDEVEVRQPVTRARAPELRLVKRIG
jgi:anti-sigma regulatory factor (Ser/Thr protein kinase)